MANTIPALKRSFLSSQVRILNAPLEPAEDWREGNAATMDEERGDLSEKVVEEVLRKVNKTIKQHNASVFPAQALSHVAQQIDALYWSAAEPAVQGLELPPDAISVDADLRHEATISSLPPSFPDLAPSPPSSPENPRPSKRPRTSALETFDASTRYARLRSQLQDLNTQRGESRKKLDEARAMLDLLRPLRDAKENVQPNLVGRGSELEAELERTKVLVARLVALLRAKKGGLGLGLRDGQRDRGNGEAGGEMGFERGTREKLEELLEQEG